MSIIISNTGKMFRKHLTKFQHQSPFVTKTIHRLTKNLRDMMLVTTVHDLGTKSRHAIPDRSTSSRSYNSFKALRHELRRRLLENFGRSSKKHRLSSNTGLLHKSELFVEQMDGTNNRRNGSNIARAMHLFFPFINCWMTRLVVNVSHQSMQKVAEITVGREIIRLSVN